MLSGCASGPAFQKVSAVPSDKALIYVYRPSALSGGVYSPTVKIGDNVAFNLSNGGYFPYVVSPGKTEISISNLGTRSIDVDAVAGETYYVKGGLIFMALGIPYIELETAELGASEIADCKRINSNEGSAQQFASTTPVVANADQQVNNQNVDAAAAIASRNSYHSARNSQNDGSIVFGLSSITVEKLAKAQGCRAVIGASVTAHNGPTVEDYKVNCEDGRQLFAHCEYRQCVIQ